jgi:hypothetical protein
LEKNGYLVMSVTLRSEKWNRQYKADLEALRELLETETEIKV